MRIAIAAGLALATAALASDLTPPRLSVISLPLHGRAELTAVQKQVSLDIFEVKADHALACAGAAELEQLKNARIPFTVVYQDAEDMIDSVHPLTSGVGAYHTYDSVNAELKALAAAHPEMVRVEQIGTSVEGRAINALVIQAPGATPVAERPKVLIMGLHHAREWISVEVPMALIKTLLDGWAANDEHLHGLLATRNMWIVPIVNPDGLEYSQQHYTMWRKNRHKTWSMPGVNGVDPNRNYGFEFVGSGSSSMPFSETYRGPGPFSEPETQAIKALADREKFTATISYHSYSELVLFPWGYTDKHCQDDGIYRKLATEMAAITKYTPETGSDLYLVNGECDDYMYGQLGAWAMTVELGKQFIPKDKDIPSITGPNVQAALHAVEECDHLHADPGIMLHLVERLAGTPGSPKGPWSPGAGDEALRTRTLDWASRELGHRLSALAATEGMAAIEPHMAELAKYPELKGALRAARAAVSR